MDFSPPKGIRTVAQALESMQDDWGNFNVLGWVTDFRPPITTKTDEFKSDCSIRDASSEDKLEIACFRKRAQDLPQISSNGDIVLFRNIKQNKYRRATAWTNIGTSYIVFPYAELAAKVSSAAASILVISYPPHLSHSVEELAYVKVLHAKSGFHEGSHNTGGALSTMANPGIPQSVSIKASDGPRPKKARLIENVKERDFVDLLVEVVKVYAADPSRVEAYFTDYTENKHLYKYSPESQEREGDPYGYNDPPTKDWRGPWGQRTIQICCYDQHGHKIKGCNEGDVVELKNVQIKYGKEKGWLEGAIHRDMKYPDRTQVFPTDKDDQRVKDLVGRRTSYWEQARADGLRCPDDHDDCKKRMHEEQKSHGRKKRAKQHGDRQATKIDDSLRAAEQKSDIPNLHVKRTDPNHPLKPLADILDNETNDVETPGGVKYRFPFQHINYHATVRVVDYIPDKLEDFAALLPAPDDTEFEEAQIDRGTGSQRRSGQRWVWRFALVVEDGRPTPQNAKRERLELNLFDEDAEYLLKLDAEDLRNNNDTLQQLRQKLFTLWGNLEEVKIGLNQGKDDRTTVHSCKSFHCRIKEYGVHTPDRVCLKTEQCRPEHWERRHRMFQTTIM